MAKDVKRRKFLKYSAAGLAAAAMSHYVAPLLTAHEGEDRPYVDRCTGKKVEGLPTTCGGCSAGCGILAFVRGGQLVKLSGNPSHPVNRGALCLVGQAAVYSVYDPERVLKPRVRVGKRGGGRWSEIGWDEAVATLAGKLKKPGAVIETAGGPSIHASREFASRFGATLVSHAHVVSPNREAAILRTFGARYDVPDIAETHYILNFGSNPFESGPFGIGTAGAMVAARSKGGAAKLVTFDPRLSATAGKSDEWMPLLPGSDAVVALAMANAIMSEGLADEGFIARNTNTTPARLRAHLSQYTPASAARISGLDADDIKRIAIEYASSQRAVLLTGGGVSKHADGTTNERAVRLLPVITGKVNRPGCNIIPRTTCVTAEGKGSGPAETTPESFYQRLVSGRQRVGAYVVHGADPAYASPMTEELVKVIEDEEAVPFLACIDTHVTDTGRYADMILPAATFLEEYGLQCSPGPGAEPVIGYRRQVVMPAGDSRPYVDVLASVAAKAGRGLPYSDSEGYADMLASKVDGLTGGTDALAAKGFFALSRHGAGHPVGGLEKRIELAWGGALPGFDQPREYKGLAAGEFLMVTFAPSGYREGFTENNMLLKEINNVNRVFMNSGAVRAMGAKNGDRVRLTGAAGNITAEVVASPGVHPKAVALARGSGHEGYGNIEKGIKFASDDPFTKAIWWETQGEGVNPSRVMPFNIDNASGGQAWMMTRVTVEKA